MFITKCNLQIGNLEGQSGYIEDSQSSGTDAVINTGIGYIFNRAIDSVTPMGQILNFFDKNDECSDLNHEIKVVLGKKLVKVSYDYSYNYWDNF